MVKNNPFTLMYGIPASSTIDRNDAINTITKSFLYSDNMFMYLITGIRGTGKTVLLRKTADYFSKEKNWIVIDLNPQGQIISSLANNLCVQSKIKKLIEGWSISFNLPYVTISKEPAQTISDPEIVATTIIENLAKQKKKILITIDEVNNTKELKEFANFYQAILGKSMPVYLLMTGLKENINSIINDKAMTFLTRSPKIELEPLGLPSIAIEYQNIFDINKETAVEMAKLTNGYAFAYQVLGFLFFESEKRTLDRDFIKQYDTYLWNNGYNKFWCDLTHTEKEFVMALAQSVSGSREDIIGSAFSKTNYTKYRQRLLEKGIIKNDGYNKLSFVLPRFKEFIEYAKEF